MALFPQGERRTPITTVPHQLLLNGWKSRLQLAEIAAVDAALGHLVHITPSNEINTARWLPCEITPLGHGDWEGSPLLKIWDKVCERDRARTCWCFAVFLWEHMLRRPDAWHFKIMHLDNAPMAATRYYRCPVENERGRGIIPSNESVIGTAAISLL